MAEVFSDLVVQFTPKGMEVVQTAMSKVAASAGATAQMVGGASSGMAAAAQQWGNAWQQTAASVANSAAKGFGQAAQGAQKAAKDIHAAFAGGVLPTAKIDASHYNRSVLVVAEGIKSTSDRAKLMGQVLAKAFAEPDAPMKEFATASAYLGEQLTARLVAAGKAAGSLTTAFKSAAGALSPLVMGVSGLVIAGVHASAAGQILSMQFEELSRQIASVFAPTIYAVMDRLSDLIRWFR